MQGVPLNGVMFAFGVGEVVHSKNKRFAPGALVQGLLGWQEYSKWTAASARGLENLEKFFKAGGIYFIGYLIRSFEFFIVMLVFFWTDEKYIGHNITEDK